ncbi:ExbD/TolR family protein [Sphingomonas sp. 22176]|uniref:ExbD/TolR family protein n=1 Tax=Sphingomonas sp. 22176 TaxID=3453884 RepID=UPI003F86E7F7
MAISPKLNDELTECSEINLTPFIDVILVLLIIFMIAAQASSVSQSVDLPSSAAKPLEPQDKPIVVTLRPDRSLQVDDRPVSRDRLHDALLRAGAKPDDRVLLLADRTMTYEGVMDTLDDLRDAGFTHVALVGRDRQSR